MWLPTQGQVNAATRHIASAISGGILVFGLSTKINPDTVNKIISAMGPIINDVVTLIGLVGPIIAGYYASKSASPTAQAAAVGSSAETVVKPAPGGTATVTIKDPAMAAAALDAQKKAV